jgi:hypothetical protein
VKFDELEYEEIECEVVKPGVCEQQNIVLIRSNTNISVKSGCICVKSNEGTDQAKTIKMDKIQ